MKTLLQRMMLALLVITAGTVAVAPAAGASGQSFLMLRSPGTVQYLAALPYHPGRDHEIGLMSYYANRLWGWQYAGIGTDGAMRWQLLTYLSVGAPEGSQLCLAVPDRPAAGRQLATAICDANAPQQHWRLEGTRLRLVGSNLVVGVRGNPVELATIELQVDTGAQTQRWLNEWVSG